ncbi:NAD-dependent protein deacylase Sirt4-like protein [Dinothrombium tinctorium]|uniref:NAD-dependent protein deacylase Sirt4-like protein n=1 Tax=Dinothrombium tinctorium TaxID=1965070 RepID=A0A3S3Q3D6_9ACAR|nr:NAD-dependent protein deacylase Sirt4-like protein [Dinothrombium tinctorium]RWS08491.1 NAD-dependent protein deacylase Sirt4-like protein [Dinothrombium tinctorium]
MGSLKIRTNYGVHLNCSRFKILPLLCVRKQHSSNFVPRHEPVTESDVNKLQTFVENASKLLVLTGAGISTESGLPDYRSEEVGLYARSNHKPMKLSQFMESEAMRKKYWTRNYIAFPRLTRIEPNAAHFTLTDWERKGKLVAIVTQNVDRLHQKSGAENVIELHGNGYVVKCVNGNSINCSYKISRYLFQQQLNELNEDLFNNFDTLSLALRPDMDVDLNSEMVQNFRVPSCPNCGGILKPDIVFFGDNVPKHIVSSVYEKVEQSDSLLVVGSSLKVYSAYRFVDFAHERKKKIAIVNIGPTRADHLNVLHICKRSGEVLPKIKL